MTKKKIDIDDIVMLVLISVILPMAFLGGAVLCVFVAFGILAGIIATAIAAFIIGLMFGIELINMI